MAALVFADVGGERLNPATRNAVSAALQMDAEVDVLVCGAGCDAAAREAAGLDGVRRVLVAQAASLAHQLPENVAPLLVSLAAGYGHIVAAATSTGKNVLPRVAALLDVAQISEIGAVLSPDTFERPIYAGNANAVVCSRDAKKVVTVRATRFAPAGASGNAAEIVPLAWDADTALAKFVRSTASAGDRPELTTASVVVSGGRGMASRDNFRLLESLADTLHAAIGASRAAVDAGFAPSDAQVGQTGKVVAADLYIAVGISGAIQHLAGMKDSKTIVAINKDADAPIFQVADIGIVGDLFDILPVLTRTLAGG
ncbi:MULTISPECIES: electron transfer flavoprotein subunit alpha/FixB family protein [Cupriavidus]